MSKSIADLKLAYAETSDQLNVMRLAFKTKKLSSAQTEGLHRDMRVAAEDLKIIAGLLKKAEEAPPAEETSPAEEVKAAGEEAPDELFKEASREEVFTANKKRLDTILDKLAAHQTRVSQFEAKHGANKKTEAFRGRLAGLIHKLAEVTEKVPLAEEVAGKALSEVEDEVAGLNAAVTKGQLPSR